jgi:hypothetical protein
MPVNYWIPLRGASMRKIILITALALGMTAAPADNGFWYVGAGVVSNSVTGITVLAEGFQLPTSTIQPRYK